MAMLVPAIAAAAVPAIASAAGVGRNTKNATTFGDTRQYDPNATRYGRDPNAADRDAGRFRALASDASRRMGPQANFGRANAWDEQGLLARQAQGQAANLMMNRATGATPSIAQMQADRQMQQAEAAQASQAAGARGAGGLALAGQAGAGNLANAQGAISGQAQINAAQERLAAENAAFGAYSGMRQGDLGAQGMSADMAKTQAMLESEQRARNDAYANQLYGHELDVHRADLTGGIANNNTLGTTFTQGQGQKLDQAKQNADREMEWYKNIMGGGQGVMDANTKMGLSAPPPAMAKGGPVHGRRPYLVGEQGPELIVPNQDGYVLTNDQTRDAVGRAYGGLVQAGGYYPSRQFGGPVSAGGMHPLAALLGGGGGMPAGASGPAMASYDRLNPDMSMDVGGSLQAHSDAATRYQRDPSGMGGGLMGGY